jgi:hypothetical protein
MIQILPPKARRMLIKAYQSCIDPDQRSKAIDRVTEKLRIEFPEYFKPDEVCNGDDSDE